MEISIREPEFVQLSTRLFEDSVPTMKMCGVMGGGSGVRIWEDGWADGVCRISRGDSLPSGTSSTVAHGQVHGNNRTDF